MFTRKKPARRQPFACSMTLLSGLIVGITVSDNECPIAAAEDSTTAALDAARAVAKTDSEGLRSAIGAAEFTVLTRQNEDDEPKLWSKAKVHVYFDGGKYHIQLVYEKKLERVSTTDKDGKTTERIADDRYDDVRIIVDDDAVYVVNFSERIRPTGCSGDIWSKEQMRSGLAMSGFPWAEPARLWKKLPDVDQIIKKLGADAIAFSEIAEGRFRATYPVGKPYAEVDFERSAGFNVTAFRAFNPKQKNPVQSSEAIWKQADGKWYVSEFIEEWDNREVQPDRGHFSRSTLKFDKFEPNVKVEPSLFSLNSVPIPARTRFIDRRPNPTQPFQYWNGMALQTYRP
jgi:hypothetical protein